LRRIRNKLDGTLAFGYHLRMSMSHRPVTGFVLGAGLGTRLRPLTNEWPKPLLPVGGRPVITYAFAQLKALGIRRIIVNTHHLPHRYDEVFPDARWEGVELIFRHEPELLETGGGIKNIEDLVEGEHLAIFNGDVVSNLPLEDLWRGHLASAGEATLALRSGGGPLQIALDAATGRIRDIGNRRGTNASPLYLFSGIYFVARPFFRRLAAGHKESVVPTFLRMIDQEAGLGGMVLDEGMWSDIGTPAELARMDALLREKPTLAAPYSACLS
jgi:mannose-1-phosphate guanylyltransferase